MLKFSIITPVFNRADCVARCIESVLSQKKSDSFQWEHILVDDGSSDDTSKIIQDYEDNNDAIKFIRFSHNRGTNAARNAAIQAAEGDYCIILDSDDYFREDALVSIANIVLEHPHYVEFAFAVDDRQEYYNALPMLVDGKQAIFTFEDFLLGKVSGDFVHVIKTSTLQKYPFDEHLKIFEGVFFLRFYKESKQILFTNKIITNRERGRADSVTLTGIEISSEAILKAKKALDLRLQWFKEDYKRLKVTDELGKLLVRKFRYCLMLGQYQEAGLLKRELDSWSMRIPVFFIFLYKFKLGVFYQQIFSFLLKKKYHI